MNRSRTELNYKPNHVVINVRTNEINTRKTSAEIANNIIRECGGIKIEENDVTISSLVYRKYNKDNIKIDDINKTLKIL